MRTFLHDTGIIFGRQLRLALREPLWIVIGLTQPVLYLVLFGPLLEPLASQLGATNAYALFVPGLLVQLAVFGALFVGFGFLGEYRDGVIEAERVTPASRTALLLGRVLKDMLQVSVQSAILVSLSFAFGLRGSLVGILIGYLIAVVLTGAVAAAGYALALTVKTEDSLAAVANGVSLPLILLSGILLPMTLAPGWLQTVSDAVPIKHIVQGMRDLFAGDIFGPGPLWALFWTAVLVTAGVWVGTRVFRRQNA
ncbi:ABC-2 type transport system permease protein [Microbacteriaceae bacterium SG_E_30_P1]|uniref:Transport permease protein n=1 Tax=Antiquaquibacter oligotrophicus TaxID=2880260 RepID=A0ABT6KQ78_9MICO|nr:ABC transporter permease [Antiquaquibacter oligotrophicus]MDH6181976.1 ABC-2 type transport system permease protein [Antiquaquibacter oligotrophicus]UDF12355.1 ABC transporter permease [Antiquaquibacter oligotrophicus]